MGKLAKLRRKVKRLKRENLDLIIEANAARVRAGEANEALEEWKSQPRGWVSFGPWVADVGKLDG